MMSFCLNNYLFCPKIRMLDKNINKLKQKAALHGMVSLTPFFLMDKKKNAVVFQSPVLSVLQVGISCC